MFFLLINDECGFYLPKGFEEFDNLLIVNLNKSIPGNRSKNKISSE